MKRFALILIAFALSVAAKGQVTSSVMTLYSPFGDTGLVAMETTGIGVNHVGYAYLEMGNWRGNNFGQKGEAYTPTCKRLDNGQAQ